MGLDNGFRATGIMRKDIPDFVELPSKWDLEDGSIEFAYYRKDWGLRDAILTVLHASRDGGSYRVDAEDFPAIFRAMTPFFSKEYWENNGDSIWEHDEVFEYTLLQQIINLKWLHSYMVAHPEVECYFYDSF